VGALDRAVHIKDVPVEQNRTKARLCRVFRSDGNLPESLSRLTSFGVLIFHHAYELSAAVEMMVFVPFFLVYLGNYQREMLISYQDSQIFLHPLLNGPNH